MAKERHKVLVIPGLGDHKPLTTPLLELSTNHWRKQGLEPMIHSIGWHNNEDSFEPKLERLVDLIDELVGQSDKVSLVGTSAGGSAALNAFIERRDAVHRVINVCGRLKKGNLTGFRSFESKTSSSQTFAQSVQLCETNLETLTEVDKQKIMTVRSMFGDQLVPADTSIIEGAYNTQVPTLEHMLSIGAALTVFSKPVIFFLKGE